ncbi:MAG: glycosyltransferase [Candidatus Hydrogenedentota bacterium]
MNSFSITEKIKQFYDENIQNFQKFRVKNWYYYQCILSLLKFLIPENKKILDIGCGPGDFLYELKPSIGIGIDLSPKIIEQNKNKYPHLNFYTMDIQKETHSDTFDYITIINTIGDLEDVWQCFRDIRKNCKQETRIVIIYYNYLYEPLLKLAEKLGLRMPQPNLNWLNFDDISNLLYLNGFEIIKMGYKCVFPFYVPLFSKIVNSIFSSIPLVHRLGLISYLVAKPSPEPVKSLKEYTVSVIVPVKNERDNIEPTVKRTPNMGLHTEIIFVDGNSRDGTREKILEIIEKYKGIKEVRLIDQGKGKGKCDAVQKGFNAAQGEILMILDGDLTVPPEDLEKFYKAIEEGRGELINGSRLVYQMEDEAMRTLNLIANKFFASAFTFILGQNIKDTLCGTKVLKKNDYLEIVKNRAYFGEFDPFGDFDLLFGASKNNLKIVELPIRYRRRIYGDTKINRFKHGLLLLKMCMYAFLKFKL